MADSYIYFGFFICSGFADGISKGIEVAKFYMWLNLNTQTDLLVLNGFKNVKINIRVTKKCFYMCVYTCMYIDTDYVCVHLNCIQLYLMSAGYSQISFFAFV